MIYCRGKSINGEVHSRRAPVSILFEKNLNFFRYLSISYFKNLIYIFELLIKTMASTSLFLIFRICPCIVTKTRISVALCLLSKVKETAALLYKNWIQISLIHNTVPATMPSEFKNRNCFLESIEKHPSEIYLKRGLKDLFFK